MSKKKAPTKKDYEVGYGKPPKESQFKKGQSGNLWGRPKGSKNKKPTHKLEDLFEKALFREVRVNDESGARTMTMMEAIIQKTVLKAAQGDFRSQKLALEMYKAVKEKKAEEGEDTPIININFI